MTHPTKVTLMSMNVGNVTNMWKDRRSSVLIVRTLTVIFTNFVPEMLVENINDTCKVYLERELFLCFRLHRFCFILHSFLLLDSRPVKLLVRNLLRVCSHFKYRMSFRVCCCKVTFRVAF